MNKKIYIALFIICFTKLHTAQLQSTWNSRLIKATLLSKSNKIEEAMRHNANINCHDHWRRSPLIIASQHCSEDIMVLLLSYQPNIEHTDDNNATALIVAAQSGNKKSARVLLNAGANKEHRDFYNMTALDWAKRHRYKDIMKLLGISNDEIHLLDCPRCQLLQTPRSTKPQLSPPYNPTRSHFS